MIKVKSIWEGKVGFPEKFYNENEVIVCGKDKMYLKGKKSVGYSEYFKDRFGRGKYRLIYFMWNPEESNQIKLI